MEKRRRRGEVSDERGVEEEKKERGEKNIKPHFSFLQDLFKSTTLYSIQKYDMT
jgi:hypothetical protein